MLHVIGLGLDDGEITVKGMKALENCDEAVCEFYTNTETVDLEELEERASTPIRKISREEVEQEMLPVELAGEKNVAFLVSGDPLTATTHYQVKKEAESRGTEVQVHHAPSILTSVAETGLDLYKFGRTVTVPEKGAPGSIGEMVEKNDSVGLHTLVLLDVNLFADEAADKLLEIDNSLADRTVAVVERANSSSQSITVTELENVGEMKLGETPHCMALAGELSHKEEEFLEDHR